MGWVGGPPFQACYLRIRFLEMRSPASRPRWAFIGLFVVLVGFLAATYSFRRITDVELNSFQTRALVLHGDADLSRYERVSRPGYFTRQRGEQLYSIYGTGISVVAAPAYAVLARTDASEGVRHAAGAIPFVAAAIVLMYVLLSRMFDPMLAAAGALVFGFGTTMWPLASMALYQHGPVAMFQVLGLMGLFSDKQRAPALAGFGFAAAVFIRPTTAIPFALVGLYYLTRGKRPTIGYALGAVVPLAGMVIQNRWLWESWLTGGYAQSGIGFNADMPRALWGLTFGWWRGIFVYSPILLMGLVGFVMALRRLKGAIEPRLVVLGVSSVATILFYSKWTTWWNGLNQFGYRYLLDAVPFLIVLAAYAVARSERARVYAMPLAALSILTMTFGAAPNGFGFDGVKFATRLEDTSLGQAWINFFDHPLQGLFRLVGVAAIGALFIAVARRSEPQPRSVVA